MNDLETRAVLRIPPTDDASIDLSRGACRPHIVDRWNPIFAHSGKLSAYTLKLIVPVVSHSCIDDLMTVRQQRASVYTLRDLIRLTVQQKLSTENESKALNGCASVRCLDKNTELHWCDLHEHNGPEQPRRSVEYSSECAWARLLAVRFTSRLPWPTRSQHLYLSSAYM